MTIGLGLLVVFILVGFFIFQQLPSVGDIGKAFKSHSKNSKIEQSVSDVTQSQIVSNDPSLYEVSKKDSSDETQAENSKINEAMLEDLTSQNKPLSDFCSSLKNAKDGMLSQKEFGEAFTQSLSEDKRDPRIQAIKPMLRFVMRLPKMTEMIDEAQAAVERSDEGFLKKAEFYAKAFSAFTEMKEHQPDIESVMDRSYLFLGLNKLIAAKPEFLNDPRLQNYCSDIELSFNQSTPVDFDQEKKNFLKFLEDMNVKPKEIGFDPYYKSDVKFNFAGEAMTIDGGWPSDLVKSEVDMQVDLKKKTQ